ncbi:MAG: hypothetical protein QW728_00130 [Thermoplasmata archaeon]
MKDYSGVFRVFTFVNAFFSACIALFVTSGWGLKSGYLAVVLLSSFFMGFPAAFIGVAIAKILYLRTCMHKKDACDNKGAAPFDSPYIKAISFMMAIAALFVIAYLLLAWNTANMIGIETAVVSFGPLLFLVEVIIMVLLIRKAGGDGRKESDSKKEAE